MNIENIIQFISKLQDFVTFNSSFDTILKGVFIYLAFFWIALVIWVAKDIISRSNSITFHVLVIILNIFLPIFGLMIYLLVRPARTLLDKYYEDLEYQVLIGDSEKFCGKCNAQVNDDFKFCGKCGDSLMNECKSCKNEFLKEYFNCPFCGKKSDKKPKIIKTEKVEKGKKTEKTEKVKKSAKATKVVKTAKNAKAKKTVKIVEAVEGTIVSTKAKTAKTAKLNNK